MGNDPYEGTHNPHLALKDYSFEWVITPCGVYYDQKPKQLQAGKHLVNV